MTGQRRPAHPPFRRAALRHRRQSDLSGPPLDVPSWRHGNALAGTTAAALRRLFALPRQRGGRGVRLVQQLEVSDCGAAALMMTLDHLGVPADPAAVRRAVGGGRGGVTARALLHAARSFGVAARGVRVEDPRGLAQLPRGSILHWNVDHFVVLDGVTRRGVRIVDPALGHREVPMADVDRSFSGIGLVFEATAADPARRRSRRPAHGMRRLAAHVRHAGVWPLVVGATLLAQGATLAFPFLLRHVVDRSFDGRLPALGTMLVLAGVALALAQASVLGVRAVALGWLRARVDYRLTLTILGRLFELPYEFFEARSTGDLLLRVRSTTTLRQIFTGTVLSAFVDGFSSIVLLVVVATLDWVVGATLAAVVAVQALTLLLAWRPQRELTVAALEAQARSQSRLVQLLSGAQAVKLAGADTDVVGAWSQLLADEVNRDVRRNVSAGLVDAVLTALRVAAPVALLAVGATRVAGGDVSPGTMLAAVSLGVAALVPIAAMLTNAFQLAAVSAYVERIDDILDQAPEGHGTLTPDLVVDSVQLRGLTFAYPGGPPVLDGIDLDIAPGETIAIIGSSGAGKSTLAKLIAGLHQPTAGTVSIGHVPLADLDVRAVRRRLGFVPQQPFFFAGTVRDNITLFRDHSDEEVRAAAAVACVAGEVEDLPAGYETMLIDQGGSLSGGQLQRLGLARAVLAQPRVLVLDEATSALDPETERAVMDRLAALPVAIVLVTHREAVARRADRTYVLSGGRLRLLTPDGPVQP